METNTKECTFGSQGLSSRSKDTKKVRFFLSLSQLKKLSKSGDVHAQNKMFLALRNEILLPLKICVTEGGLHYVYSLMGVLRCIFIVHGVYTGTMPNHGPGQSLTNTCGAAVAVSGFSI